MTIQLFDGPYDGIEIDHNDVNLYCELLWAANRKFIFMPSRDRWDLVRETGEKEVGEDTVCYELIGSPVHTAQYDHNAEQFGAAQQQEAEGRVLIPDEPDWSQYLHFFYVRGSLEQPVEGWSTLTDEKGRHWTYCQHSHELVDPPSPPQTQNAGCPMQFGMTTVSTMEELVNRLTDILD